MRKVWKKELSCEKFQIEATQQSMINNKGMEKYVTQLIVTPFSQWSFDRKPREQRTIVSWTLA